MLSHSVCRFVVKYCWTFKCVFDVDIWLTNFGVVHKLDTSSE